MQARYCPGHREAPEQEFDVVQALSSNEGVISPKDTAMSVGSVKAEQVSKQGDYTVQQQNRTFTPFSNSEGEVASSPLKQGEDCHEDPSASHVHGGANATDTREEADNSGGTDNLQLRGNVRQVHPASKWDRVSGQVPHFQQHNSPSHLGQVQHQKDPYRGEEGTSMVSHSGLVRHQKDPCRCEETSKQQECGAIQEGHCPGHKEAPEQELVLGQAFPAMRE